MFATLGHEPPRFITSVFVAALLATAQGYSYILPTGDRMEFYHVPRSRSGATTHYRTNFSEGIFPEQGIYNRSIKHVHPRTDEQAERMTDALGEAVTKRHPSKTHDQLRSHLQLFVEEQSYARRLKTPYGVTLCKRVPDIGLLRNRILWLERNKGALIVGEAEHGAHLFDV